MLSLLLRCPVPDDVAVVAECGLVGELGPPVGRWAIADDTLLSLAKVRGMPTSEQARPRAVLRLLT